MAVTKSQNLASIDLGTNTCLMLVAKVDGDSVGHSSATDQRLRTIVEELADFSTIVRMGQGVDATGSIHPDAKSRVRACLATYCDTLKKYSVNPEEVIAVATAQARDSKNGPEFFASLKAEFGIQFRTLTGDQEAELTYLGARLPSMVEGNVTTPYGVIDIGGGSTELKTSLQGMSLQMGAVRFTERYLKTDPVTDDEFWNCREAIDLMVSNARKTFSQIPKKWIAVAGTATTIGQWQLGASVFSATQLNGLSLTRGDVHRLVEDLKWRTLAEKKALVGIDPKRADVILAGSLILWRVMEGLGISQVEVSTRGLRYGVMEYLP